MKNVLDAYYQAFHYISQARRLLIVGHIHPDGDALSSVCALLEVAESYQVTAEAFCSHKKDKTVFDYLPHINRINSNKEKLDALDQYDVIVAVDCGSLSRTDLEEEILALKNQTTRPYVIEFDHHPHLDDYADLEIRQPEKAATAEVIHDFLVANQVPINREVADCVLTGLLADTGNFLYSKTSEANLSIASQMVAYGARLPKIIESLNRNQNLLTMRLWGLTLENLRINEAYNLAYSVLTKKELDSLVDLGTPEEIDRFLSQDVYGEIAGFLSNLAEVDAIMLLREDKEGYIKGSLRTSKEGVDISSLAQKLGGGGHAKASGFVVAGHLVKDGDVWKII